MIREYSLEAKLGMKVQILFWQLVVVEPRALPAMIPASGFELSTLIFQGESLAEPRLGPVSEGSICHGWGAVLLEVVSSPHPAPRIVSYGGRSMGGIWE